MRQYQTKPTPSTPQRDTKKKRRDWKKLFLDALSESPNVAAAASAAHVNRPYVYEARKNDIDFASAWDNAINVSLDNAEGEMYRRAVSGFDKPVFYQGEECGLVREHSDSLLMFLLKAHRPEKYRETIQQQLTGADGGAIEISDIEAIRAKRWAQVAPLLAELEKQEKEKGKE